MGAMDSVVFTKTNAGQAELSGRRLKLPARLRTLLIMVNGQHTAQDLLTSMEPMGITVASLEELLTAKLIEPLASRPTPSQGTNGQSPPADLAAQRAAQDHGEEVVRTFIPKWPPD